MENFYRVVNGGSTEMRGGSVINGRTPQKRIEVKAGKVWARYNGVSIAVTPATEEYARTYYYCGEPFEHDWRRPGNEVYPNCEHIACAETGEIIMPSKRIPIKPSARVANALREYQRAINELRAISERVYGSCDCDSPMWTKIEELLHEQASIAIRHHVTPEQFHRLFVKEMRHD